ncbi:hypothetical protein BC937DRAFT_95001 [Endogone sp. FLAS-F59071]|nr:hypothetical protein BC937DRAFT_95001 [Endogone sp. FLAS-F59071]|eukprot:RUS20530.1 hypothetical protein BC937DRAFT_95001 [Endogone sp. FLAS-F59071]
MCCANFTWICVQKHSKEPIYLRSQPLGCSITALFLATKSENERMSIEQFCADMRKTKEAVLSLEFVISQGLKFEYYIHHPFRACHGLFLDIDVCPTFSILSSLPPVLFDYPSKFIEFTVAQILHQTNTKDTRKLKEAYYKAIDNVRRSLFSDLCFLYQPSQIALGCFKRAGREIQWDGVEKFIAEKFSTHLAMLTPILEDVIRTLDNYKVVEQGMAAQIDRVLIKSSNPAKNPESAL